MKATLSHSPLRPLLGARSLRFVRRAEAAFVLGLSGFLWLAPNVNLIPPLGLYNGKRVVQIGLLCLVAGLLLASKALRQQWLQGFAAQSAGVRWGLGAVLGLGVLSSAGAPMPAYAGTEVAHLALLVVAAGMVAAWYPNAPMSADRLIVGVVSVSVALYALQFAVGYGMHLATGHIPLWPDGFIGFANIRHFNQYQTWTLPLLAVPVLWCARRWMVLRIGAFALAALWWMLIIASDVRGTALAMGIAAVGVGLIFRKEAYGWLRVQGASLVAGGLLYLGLFYLVAGVQPELVDRLSDGRQYAGRLEYWGAAGDMIGAHPWLGAGPMHFAWPLNYFGAGAHPHNALVQWAAEWGLPSTLIVVGLAGWGFVAWVRRERFAETASARRQPSVVRVALVASVLAGAAHAMVSGIIVAPVSQVLMVLIVGWAWGRYRTAAAHQAPTPRMRPGISAQTMLCVLAVVAAGWITWRAQADLPAMETRRTTFIEAADRTLLSPRYWQQGFFGIPEARRLQPAEPDADPRISENR